MNRRSALIAMAMCCFAISACQKVDPRVNKTNFEKIQVGMSRSEVEQLLGDKFNDSPDGDLFGGAGGAAVGLADPMALSSGGTKHTWCQWGSEKKCILVCFAHDKVTGTKSVGLK